MVGHTTSCFFKTGQTMHTKLTSVAMQPSYSTQMTLHAILWPTALFVAGFVATFISLIYVCRDWDMDFSDTDFCIYITGLVDV